ncbi:MAG: urate hydroxylase PuuD [Acidobacteriota bacterium]
MELSWLEAIFRWMHVLVGVIWIGHLYFFNWVNAPLAAKLAGETKKSVVPELMPRALYWFRWGAAWTWITGVLLLLLVYYMNNNTTNPDVGWTMGGYLMIAVTFLAVFVYDTLWKTPLAANVRGAVAVSFIVLAVVVALFVYWGQFTYRGTLIHTGALFGTIMAFNVWFRIWPAQQKIIRAVKEGTAPDGDLVKLAGLRSKHNTYLSLPLFWAMVGQHTTYFAGGNLGLTETTFWIGWLVIILVGWHIIWQCYKKSGKVEGF